MKALVIEKPGKAVVMETARPEPRGSEVLIEVNACGICGTDVHRLTPGDRVAVEPNISCDTCPACLSNRQNFCEGWQAVGVTLPGGMAEFVCAPEKAVFDIGRLPFTSGAFVEPLSCVLHGMEQAAPRPADRVLIVGAGPIGILLMKTAIMMGASALTVVDRTRSRMMLAGEEGGGIVSTLDSIDSVPQNYFDLVIDATGVPALMERTTGWARPGGRVLLF
jgi:D-arabinitol dehydrogenase (NADP+)